MTAKVYRVRLLFSTLTVAEAENPVLLEGEVWTEKDASTGHSTGRRKVGDGVTAFTSLPFEPSAASITAASVTFTPAGTIAAANVQAAVEELDGDARMSNARTPTAHAASHGDGGGDEITVSQDQVTGLGTALAGKETAGAAAAAVTAHEGASDPHPQYLTQEEGDGRYRQTATALTDADIPAGIARDSEVTAAIGAHEAAADPHPGYLTAAEGDAAYAPAGHVGSGGAAHANAVASGAAGFMTGADKAKLDGVASGATANATDAALRDRATHTGTQTASTISDFNSSSRAQTEAALIAGENVTITPAGSGATRTLTIAATGGGGGDNSFSTIAVAGQSDVVADSSTDTLTIAAGAGMAITTNASTDTVTLVATGPSLGLTLAITYGMAMP